MNAEELKKKYLVHDPVHRKTTKKPYKHTFPTSTIRLVCETEFSAEVSVSERSYCSRTE